MGKIKRRVKQGSRGNQGQSPRKVVKRSSTQKLTEEDLNSIPPHMLDKIPSSMSLKPTAQSLRSMMMQRFAQPFVQMPFNQQQQQAQTMKTNNDIKEQSINQSKQEIIVQRERQANLRREEANIKSEEQRMKQQAQYDKELHQLRRTKEKVDFDKQILDENNELMKTKREKETLEALVQQAQLENQRLRTQIEKDEYANKISSLTKQKEFLDAENQGLLAAAKKLVKEEQLKQIQELTEEITRKQAENIIAKKLTDHQNELIQNELESKFRISTELYNQEIDKKNVDVKKYQADLVKQLNERETHQRTVNKYNFINKNIGDTEIEIEKLKTETSSLEQKINAFNDPKKREELKKLIEDKAKQEIDNSYLERKIELNTDIQNNSNEIDYNNAKINTYNSPEYKQQLQDINTMNQLSNYLEEMKQNSENVANNYKEVVKSEARAEIAKAVSDGVVEGNVMGVLENKFKEFKDGNNLLNHQRLLEIFNQVVAANQSANMESGERSTITKHLIDINNSSGVAKNVLEEFMTKEANGMTFDQIIKLDIKTLKEFSDRLDKLIETRTQQADIIVENQDEENDFMA